MSRPATVIVGAGVAGLTCAVAFLRAGLSCRVLEQASDLRALGAGIQISPNAVRLLTELGMGDALSREAVNIEALRFLRWKDDRQLAALPLGRRGLEEFGAPYYTLHRADLHRVLRDQLPEETLQLGAACAGVKEPGDRGVHLALADGSVSEADVAVGADGIHSTVRTVLAGDAPHYTGHVIYRGLIDAGKLPASFDEPVVRVWMGPGRHVVAYPVEAGRRFYFGAIAQLPHWHAPEWTVPADRPTMTAPYGDWSPAVRQMMETAHEITSWALFDRPMLPSWPGRHITLIGDAAHSMLPFMAQAANQAVEDAIVLAACLRTARAKNHAQALRRYEQLRQPRIDRIHRLSRANADTFHLADGPRQQARDASLPARWTTQNLRWLYGYDAGHLDRRKVAP